MTLIIIVILLYVFILTRRNYKLQFALLLLVASNDLFNFDFGFSLPLVYILVLISITTIKFNKSAIIDSNKILKYYNYEFIYLIILGIFLGIIFPWSTDLDNLRSWSQRSQGRAIVQITRLILDYVVIIGVVLFLFSSKLDIKTLYRIFATVLIINILTSCLEFFYSNPIKSIFFPNTRWVESRFTGLNAEPRVFGRLSSVFGIMLISLSKDVSRYSRVFFLLIAIFAVFLSFSATAISITILWVIYYFFIKKKFIYIVIFIIIMPLVYYFSLENFPDFENTDKKIKAVLSAVKTDDEVEVEQMADEPKLFTSFETFDRAALNFLYNNKIYILFGVGPNLISIPSTNYRDPYSYVIYGLTLDSVPHTFLVNLLSRSGLIGIILWILFVLNFLIYSRRYSIDLFFGSSSIFLVNFIVYLHFIMHISIGVYIYLLLKDRFRVNSVKEN